MFVFSSYLLLLGSLLAPSNHEELNPLFRELRQTGVSVSPTIKVPLPAPAMPDGLDADAQKKIMKELIGNDFDLENFLENSVPAPLILRIGDVTPSDPQAPARKVDIFFVAYGDLNLLANKDFLQKLMGANQKEGQGRGLTAADLARRRITKLPENEKKEGYGHTVFSFLEKVQISAAGHSFWSRTPASLVAATVLDPRFTKDPQFPNQWRPINEGKLGPPQPYQGAAFYLKATKLADPRGALFVEAHVIFTEPLKWFDGANLLRSKLPLVVQSQVRAFRRELLKHQ